MKKYIKERLQLQEKKRLLLFLDKYGMLTFALKNILTSRYFSDKNLLNVKKIISESLNGIIPIDKINKSHSLRELLMNLPVNDDVKLSFKKKFFKLNNTRSMPSFTQNSIYAITIPFGGQNKKY